MKMVWEKKGQQGKDWKLAVVAIPLKRNDRVGLNIVEDIINTPK